MSKNETGFFLAFAITLMFSEARAQLFAPTSSGAQAAPVSSSASTFSTSSVTIVSAETQPLDYVGSTLNSIPLHNVTAMGFCPLSGKSVTLEFVGRRVQVPCTAINNGEFKSAGMYSAAFSVSSAEATGVLKVSSDRQRSSAQVNLALLKLLRIEGMSKNGTNLAVSGSCASSHGKVTVKLGGRSQSATCTNDRFSAVVNYGKALPDLLVINASAGPVKDSVLIPWQSVSGR